MKTIVYIDGFNFYYGAVKGTSFKWLNPLELSKQLLPKNDIVGIKYFTAKVKPRPSDPTQPQRQQIYFRALQTIPNLTIHFGHFLSHPQTLPIENPASSGKQFERVIRTEEKGSDVNLATHLLADGFNNKYEVAVLITNDSDFLEPVKYVKNDLKKKVGILNPHKNPSIVLVKNSTFIKAIRLYHLERSQFPEELTDKTGKFHKPADW